MEKFNGTIVKNDKLEGSNLLQEINKEVSILNLSDSNRNNDDLLLTKDGSISHYQNELYWKILKTDAFQKWFKGSVVLHEDNQEPLMVFHSTLKKEFEGLNLKPNDIANSWLSLGVYFSSYYERVISTVEEYPINKEGYEKKAKTFNAFIKLKNPLILNNHEELMDIYFSNKNTSKQDFLKKGYDGIYVKYEDEYGDEYIVFNPEDILLIPSELKNI